ncbi:MAG: sulfite exporter TauE/SafE family protein [Christiangramia sp.]
MFISALIFGILGSFHCVGMCGPIAFLLPVDRTNNFKKFSQIFIYHFGRIFSYGVIGFSFGLVGKSLSIFGFQQELSIAIGVLMLLFLMVPAFQRKKFQLSSKGFTIISKLKQSLGKELKKKSPDTFFTVGFLNGFLPCGLVYMAVLGAIATGTALEGSLYMMFFGLGTIPLMTTAIWVGNFLSARVRQHIRQMIPIFLGIIALLFILRGLGLGIPYISPNMESEKISSIHSCH